MSAAFDATQARIFDALADRRPDIAGMYRNALELLSEPLGSQEARTRISHICHSMREVMNRVFNAMGRPSAPRVKPSASEQVNNLPDLLSRFPGLQFDIGEEFVPVPREVAVAMERLFKAAVQEKRRSRVDVASLLTDDGNIGHAVVSRWIESRDFFVKWAHLHDQEWPLASLPSDDELRKHVAVFDSLFNGVITEFFDARHSVEDLLAKINENVEGEVE